MRDNKWLRLLGAGALWALLYNGLWGLAWITLMRREWTEAAQVSGRTMPWTPEFWSVWIPMTVPFGLAVGAYLLSRPAHSGLHRDAVAAGLVIWVPGTLGMAFAAALTPWIIVLDSLVNLVAVLAASLILATAIAVFPTGAGSRVEGGRGEPSPLGQAGVTMPGRSADDQG